MRLQEEEMRLQEEETRLQEEEEVKLYKRAGDAVQERR